MVHPDPLAGSDELRRFNALVPLYLWTFILALVAAASLLNVGSLYAARRRRLYAARFAGGRYCPPDSCPRLHHRCSRYVPITLLALARKATMGQDRVAAWLGLGSTVQAMVLVAYLAFNLALAFAGAGGQIDWQAHHSARLAVANLPLVIGLASKNNLVSYLTGFSYESLNAIHRWTGRLVVLLLVIHIAGRVYVDVPSVATSGPGQIYIRWGILGFICAVLMVIGASRRLRNLWYSFFIISHVLLLAGFLASAWAHRPQQGGWVAAGLALYLVDRVWRTARIVWHHGFRPATLAPAEESAMVEVFEGGDTIRVTVKTSMTWRAGQHVYLHCPSISAGGHPFSIMSISCPLDPSSLSPSSHEQVLLIRVRDGLTRHLRNLARGDDESNLFSLASHRRPSYTPLPSAPIYAWTEGPYGNLQKLDQYQTVFLVSGGAGITYSLAMALDIVRRAASLAHGRTDTPCATLRLSLLWVVKKRDHVEWVRQAIRDALRIAPESFFRVHVWVTADGPPRPASPQPSPGSSVDSFRSAASSPSAAAEKEATGKPRILRPPPTVPPSIEFHAGRPDLAAALAAELAATDYADHVAVGFCGPGKMGAELASAASAAIRPGAVLKGERRRCIYFTKQEFGW